MVLILIYLSKVLDLSTAENLAWNSFDIYHKNVISHVLYNYTGRFIMFSVITNIYNKKTKGPTLMEFFTAARKLKKFFFAN